MKREGGQSSCWMAVVGADSQTALCGASQAKGPIGCQATLTLGFTHQLHAVSKLSNPHLEPRGDYCLSRLVP